MVIGEVLEVTQHPNADKLRLTKVRVGESEPLKIVCGAPNVASGQKVLVATIGATIYPSSGQPLTMKAAKIRGEESQGMICAEDELGLGSSHAGIMVLPADAVAGTKASDYFKPYNDWIYEIGLTPNRMDVMSHLGVAKDVCAYLSLHNRKAASAKTPFNATFQPDNHTLPVHVVIEDTNACKRYAGVTISDITVAESPQWLQDKLLAIGQRPINNIVDITNYVLHETGQPLHAFDAAAIKGNSIIVKTLPQDTLFTTLDEKERKLDAADLMICNAEDGMCIAGVFGGITSGVTESTTSIFLETAWFSPQSIRKTSLRHGLRTEAAVRFEKGVDISNVVNALKRAALLVKEVAGGEISSEVVDVYPTPQEKAQVTLHYGYLEKLSGKKYTHSDVTTILTSLGFEVLKDSEQELVVTVPYSKPDISLPADIVEEVLRIDGLDNIALKQSMTITPSTDENLLKESLREKITGYLTGFGFNEIVTNSITNSQYYSEQEQQTTVKMLNSLSAELDVLRPSMLESGLEAVAYNVHRKNKDLQFFEFGKTYLTLDVGNYTERERLALYLTGEHEQQAWNAKKADNDFYRAKGIAAAIIQLCGLKAMKFSPAQCDDLSHALSASAERKDLVTVGEVSAKRLKDFDVKQPVAFIDFDWELLLQLSSKQTILYKEVSKFPPVQRDLAIVIDKNIHYDAVEEAVRKTRIPTLHEMKLFDVFESDKLGADKKSLAISFTFIDEEKTLTDKEIDEMVNKLITAFEKDLNAEIRK